VVDGEVVSGEASGDGGQHGLRLDDGALPGGGERGAQFPGAGLSELRGDRGVCAFLARCHGQLLAGDDPGFRVRGQVSAVAVAAAGGGLTGVPGLRVHG
jgi:hypothetical protein